MASVTIYFNIKRTPYLRLGIIVNKLFGLKAFNKVCKLFKSKDAAKIYADNKLVGKITIKELIIN